MNPLILSLIAGLTTIIGFFTIKIKKDILSISLMFSSGVMLSITIFDLLKESIIKLNIYFNSFITILFIAIFFIIGVIISIIIDHLIKTSNDIYKVGLINLFAIIIHNIPEGMATYISTMIDTKLGVTLAISIALHNIPEGISIAVPIYYAKKSRVKAFIYVMIAGFSEFFGAVITMLFFKKYITELSVGLLLSLISGIMFYISVYELIPRAKKNIKTILAFIVGGVIMFLSIILI